MPALQAKCKDRRISLSQEPGFLVFANAAGYSVSKLNIRSPL